MTVSSDSEGSSDARAMGKPSPEAARVARDWSAVFDLLVAPFGYFAVSIAHELGLFQLLEGKRLTAVEICKALELRPRPANALLAAVTSLGLLALTDDRYALTELAEGFLLDSSPTYMGFFLDLNRAGDISLSSIRQAVASDAAQRPDFDFATFDEQAEQARVFTRAMHSASSGPGLVWPELVDLSGHRLFLDVAGGSGAHSIGACRRWPKLHAIVLDLAPVCDVADEFVAHQGLGDRIVSLRADMWVDPFPPADVHFYSNILHDWPPEKGRLLIEKSFRALERGGWILVHEALFDDEKTGPFRIAAFNMAILWATEGQQYSGRELSTMLADAGFEQIQVIPTSGYYSVVAGRRP